MAKRGGEREGKFRGTSRLQIESRTIFDLQVRDLFNLQVSYVWIYKVLLIEPNSRKEISIGDNPSIYPELNFLPWGPKSMEENDHLQQSPTRRSQKEYYLLCLEYWDLLA